MSDSLNDRLIELESIVMHQQNDLEQMNNVILNQQREIESLNRKIQQFENRLEETREGPENRDPLEERPPHY
ncbi:MAG: SlyX family protein [Planctomycetes bacterium]|nr:SlyX family protein [Planctomycetota bacterium]